MLEDDRLLLASLGILYTDEPDPAQACESQIQLVLPADLYRPAFAIFGKGARLARNQFGFHGLHRLEGEQRLCSFRDIIECEFAYLAGQYEFHCLQYEARSMFGSNDPQPEKQ